MHVQRCKTYDCVRLYFFISAFKTRFSIEMAHVILEALLKGALEVTVSVAAQALVTAAVSSTSSEHHHHHHHNRPRTTAVETASDEAHGFHPYNDDSPKMCPHAFNIEIMTPDEYARQKICIFCSKTYFESKNSSTACIHHHGRYFIATALLNSVALIKGLCNGLAVEENLKMIQVRSWIRITHRLLPRKAP